MKSNLEREIKKDKALTPNSGFGSKSKALAKKAGKKEKKY